ncbi:2-dehydropantoate 2-reductase [Gongronella butleri]|nr:2-dehydropantoate 2-reductase [Gongronella butleri]
MTPPCSILNVGLGAVGAIYSWRLAQSAAITAVCRSNYQVVKDEGLNIDSKKFGKGIFRPSHVVRTVAEAVQVNDNQAFDYALVTLKALPEVYDIGEMIAPAVKPGKTTIVLIQNGLGIEEPIVARFPDNPLISIVAYIGTSQPSLGEIKMVGSERLMVGNYLPSKVDNSAPKQRFIEMLRKGGVDANDVDDIEKLRWQKLLWNAVFSPVCLLTGMDTTGVLGCDSAMNLARNLMRDVVATANAQGYDFDYETEMANMIRFTQSTAMDFKPSMMLDYERRSPMETDAILGSCFRRAKAKGLSVPYLESVYDLCLANNKAILEEKKVRSSA